jgi:ferric-dicitrate binding protein FerR (iron transport regulator)
MQDTDYIKLVLKHLDSEASPAEEKALQNWLEADQLHRLEYQALEKIWRDSGKALNTRSFNVEAALDKVQHRLAIHPAAATGPSAPTRSLPWKRALAAASVLLILGSASWWFLTRPVTHSITATTILRVALPDGSIVNLRRGAVLSYSGRTAELSGEAFFEPVHDPSHPFRISTTHAIFEDIGTSFLINNKPNGDVLTVVSGKVKFTEKANPSNNLILSSGHMALLDGNKFVTSETTAANVISWKTGILDFQSQPLQDVAADISDFYQTPVTLSPDLLEKAGTIRVTARFDHQPLKDVLEEIQLMTGLSTRHEKGSFVFSQ